MVRDEKTLTKEEAIDKIIEEMNNGSIYGTYGKDDSGEIFFIFSDWNGVNKASELLDTKELEDYFNWGFDDEYTTCSNCGKVIRTSPDSKHWMPDFFIDDNNGEILCKDCVKSNPDNYLAHLINNSNSANTILNDDELSNLGFVHLDKSYENGWYGQEDNPNEILKDILSKYPDAQVIFNLDFQHQFVQQFSIWVDEATHNQMSKDR